MWNKETCAYEEAADHPEAYEANLRAVTGGPTQIGYMHYGDVDPFGVANSKSMADVAEQAGFQLNVYNLKFPSETEPLAQARNSVLKKDAGVVQAQQVASVSDAFLKILQTDGCIPSVQMYLKTKMVPAFGAVWGDVGKAQGEWLAEQALAKGWTPGDTALLQCTDPSLGEDVNSMFPAAVQALDDGGFALADDDVFPIKCEFTPQKAQIPVTDWLTAHPDYDHVLMTTIDDERMSGMTNAMRKAGKKEGESYLGIASGADELGQTEIKNGHESASIAFFPEKYGEWLIPILEDVMAGNPVPSFVGQGLPVDHEGQHRRVLPVVAGPDADRGDARPSQRRRSCRADADPRIAPSKWTHGWRAFLLRPELGLPLITLLLAIYLSFASEYFLQRQNLLNITEAVAVIGIAAAFATLVIIGGGIDLTPVTVMIVTGIVVLRALQHGVPVVPAVALALLAGAAIGLLNGLLIAIGNLNPFIVTLGTNFLFTGIAYVATEGNSQIIENSTFLEIGQSRLFWNIPTSSVIMLASFAAAFFLLRLTRFGTHIFAVGGGESAARLSGVRVLSVKVWLYVLSALSAAVAGIVLASASGLGGARTPRRTPTTCCPSWPPSSSAARPSPAGAAAWSAPPSASCCWA